MLFSIKVLGAVKHVNISQELGGGDGDAGDHEPGDHPSPEVQLAQGHQGGVTPGGPGVLNLHPGPGDKVP